MTDMMVIDVMREQHRKTLRKIPHDYEDSVAKSYFATISPKRAVEIYRLAVIKRGLDVPFLEYLAGRLHLQYSEQLTLLFRQEVQNQ